MKTEIRAWLEAGYLCLHRSVKDGGIGKRRYREQKRAAFKALRKPIEELRLGCVDLPPPAYLKVSQAMRLLDEAQAICRPWWATRRRAR